MKLNCITPTNSMSRINTWFNFKKIFTLLAAVFFLSGMAVGQTLIKWQGTSGGTWATGGNWVGGSKPTNAQFALIENFTGTINFNADETIGGLSIVGANVIFNNNTGGNNARTLNVGNSLAGDDIVIINSNVTIVGAGGNRTTTINLVNNNTAQIQNSNVVVSAGTAIGTLSNSAAAGNFVFNPTSTYVHNINGGTIPTATWQSGSVVSVTGVTANLPGGFNNQVFSDVVWNSTSQTTNNVGLNSNFTVLGTFTLESSGTGNFGIRDANDANTNNWYINNFIQNGGVLNLSRQGTALGLLSVYGNFNQTSGEIRRTSGSANSRIIISGSTNQNITLTNQTGGNFEVDKPSGIAILQNNISLPANLLLTNGALQLNGNSLTMSAATGVINSTNGSIIGDVSSTLRLSGATSGFTLPTITGGLFNFLSARTAALTVSHPLTVAGTLTLAGTLNVGSNTLAYQPQNYVGAQNLINTTNASTLELNGTGVVISVPGGVNPRLLGALVVNNTNDVVLGANTQVTNDLTIQNGAIILGANNLSVGGVVNGAFSNTRYISQNGAGRFFKTYTTLPTSFYFPIGKGRISDATNTFSPVDLLSLSATAPASGTINVIDLPAPAPGIVDASFAIKRYWSFTAPGLSGVTASFRTTFTGADLADAGAESQYVTGYSIAPSTSWAQGSGSEVVSRVATFNIGSAPNLSGNYTLGSKNAFSSVTLYSYQNGNWNDPNTWTEDPSGTLLVNPQVPSSTAQIFILNGKTVSLSTNVTTTGHSIVINAGGRLDMQTFTFTPLNVLSGQGLLRLNSISFPSATSTPFNATGGGTVEYYNLSATLPTTVTSYNNLWLTKDDNTSTTYHYTLGSNLTTFGDLRVRNLLNIGTTAFTIGNSTANRTLNIFGSLVNGDAAGGPTTTVISIGGFNAEHVANIYGNLINYATIDFSNDAQYATPTQRLRLNFLGSTNNQFFCDGPTEVFDVTVNKGTDQTYVLHLHATNTSHFRFHTNGNGFPIAMGTLRLGNNIVLDRLRTSGNFDIGSGPGTTPTTLNIGCQLWVDGATINRVSTSGSQALVMYGKFRITSGEITVTGAGLVPRFDGEIEIAGGKVEASKVRPSVVLAATPRGAFIMSGGELNLNRPGLPDIEGFNHAPFTMPFEDQVFIMSGGTINIFRHGADNATSRAFFIVNSMPANQNVTGGTINVTIAAANTHVISSRAPIYNLNVFKTTTSANGILRLQAMNLDNEYQTTAFPNLPAYDLRIINSLNINGVNTPSFVLGDANLILNKDFTLNTGATLNASNRTVSLTGNQNQDITLNGTVVNPLTNLVVNKTGPEAANLLGSLATITITNLSITSGLINDGNKSLRVTESVVNNGTIAGNGNVELIGTVAQSITSNGNGTFNHLILNNTNGAVGSAPVSLSGNIRISNRLTLASDRVFNINTSGLTFLSNSVITTAGNTFSANKFIRTAGNQSDFGLSRFTFNNATVLFYPIGTGSNYTPVTATLSGISTPDNQGFLQVSVNNAVLATLSTTGVPNSALLYNWRVRGNGFVTPPNVAYSFNSSVTGIWPTGVIGEGNFVGGRVVVPNRVPETTTVTSNGLISIASHTVPTDAFYTAAQSSRFNGSIKVFYNLNNGGGMEEVFTNGVFSLICHTCAGTNDDPGPGDILRMTTFTNTNQDHWVLINRDLTVAGVIFENRGLGGWNARITIAPDRNVNLGFVSGHGEIMVRSDGTPAVIPPVLGDFGDFASVAASQFNYNMTAGTGQVIIPDQPTVYPTLRLETGGNTARSFLLPSVPLQINNNFIIGDGATAFTSTASGANITIENDLRIGQTGGEQGRLILNSTGFAKIITIKRDLDIRNTNASNELSVQNNVPSGLLHTIKVGRNIIKQIGILDLDNGTGANANHAQLEFIGETDGTVTNTGGSAIELHKIIMNKGTNTTPTITFQAPFNTSNNSAGANKLVVFQNGTLIFDAPAINVSLSSGGGDVNISQTSGLEVRQGTVSMSSITGILLDGLLRIGNNGVANFNDGTNNIFIEYSGATNPRLEVLGNASLNLGGQIRRNTSSTAGTLAYVQTGGNVTVAGIGAVATRAKFELDNPGSSISMSGGNFFIQRGGGTTFGDLWLTPGTANITGGTFILSPLTAIGNQTYNINVAPAINNISFLNGGTSSATGVLLTNPLRVNNQLTISNNAVLNTNNFDVVSAGNVSIAGGYLPTTGTISFTGSGLQNLIANSAVTFNNFVLNGSSTVSVSGVSPTVSGLLNINTGTLNVGSTSLVSTGNMNNNSTQQGSGQLVLAGATAKPVSGNGSGSFQNIVINNASGINFQNNFTVNGGIAFENGTLNIGGNRLTLSAASTISGVSSARYIRTNGVKADLGVVKNINAGAFDFTFPVGVFGKYTPVRYQASANTAAGSIKVAPVSEAHPLTTDPANKQLNYYWDVETTGLAGLNVNHTYTYVVGDVNGTESLYQAGRSIFGDWAPNYGGFPASVGGVNTTSKLITLSGVDFIFGEYTAGEESELQQVLTYYSRNATGGGNWDDINTWSTDQTLKHAGPPVTSGLPPYGQPVVIADGHTVNVNVNNRIAYSTSIAGLLNLGTTFGHNLGILAGQGIMQLEPNASTQYVIPGGLYSAFTASATGGTFHFTSGSTGDLPVINPPTLTQFNNILLSGSGLKRINSSATNFLIRGNLSIVGGTLENTANNNIIISGNWINNVGISGFNRGFIPGSFVRFDGFNQQITGNNVFGGVQINGGGTKTFATNNTINGVLALNNGIVEMGTHTLSILTSEGDVTGGSASSYVRGNLLRTYLTGSNVSKVFQVGDGGYSPITVTYPSVSTSGNLVARAVAGVHPNIASSCISNSKYINRYWNITSTSPVIAPTNFNATATFLNPGDLVGGVNTSLVIPSVYTGTVWSLPGVGTRTSTSTQATGVQTYGSLILGEPVSPVSVSIVGTAMPVCPGSTINFTAIGFNGGTAPGYNWYRISAGNTFTGQAFTQVYSSTTLLGGDMVRVQFTSSEVGCVFGNPALSNTITVSYTPNNAWTGAVSADWNNGSNWCGGLVPTATTDIVINSGTPFAPLLTSAGVVRDITIGAGAVFNQSANLSVFGNFTNNGTLNALSTTAINFNGATNQTIGGISNTAFFNININSASGVTFTSPQTVFGTLTFNNTSASVTSNGNLVIGSNATFTGRVGVMAAGNDIVGNIRVQRYMADKKVYRFYSSPVSNGNLNNFNSQIWITGFGGDFDLGTVVPTLYWYVETLPGGLNTGWRAASSKNTPLQVGRGYNLFINSRNTTINQTAATATTTSVIVEQVGSVNRGTINLPITYTNHASTADGWNLVGNPYPSQVDFGNASAWTLTHIVPAITFFNPETVISDGSNSSTAGSYVSYQRGVACPITNPNCLVIPSQQGFWVRATATGAAMQITEASKTSNAHRAYFRIENENVNSMWIKLTSPTHTDYAAIKLGDGSLAFDKSQDVLKIENTHLNLAIVSNDSRRIAIDHLPLPNPTDSVIIPLDVRATAHGAFEISFEHLDNMDFEAQWGLLDKFLGTTQPVTAATRYAFTTQAASTASFGNRFVLIVKNITPRRLTQNSTATSSEENASSSEGILQTNENSSTNDNLVINSVSLNDVDGLVSLYPNPAGGNELFVKVKRAKVSAIEVTDVLGNKLGGLGATKISGDVYKLNVSGLERGAYFVKVSTDAGVGVYKFIRN